MFNEEGKVNLNVLVPRLVTMEREVKEQVKQGTWQQVERPIEESKEEGKSEVGYRNPPYFNFEETVLVQELDYERSQEVFYESLDYSLSELSAGQDFAQDLFDSFQFDKLQDCPASYLDAGNDQMNEK